MDVFNKLYSSVSSTVSQIQGVLPGNPVTREFEVVEHIASAGPGLLWKIYRGYKKSTRQEVAVFEFEKRQLERWQKDDREVMLETLKRGISQLTKIRHPQVLTVQHPLEESRDSLAFATEPVFASLANLLGNRHNLPQPQPTALTGFKLFDVEIKYGIIQLAEGLAFLHSDVKLLHRNICPESIIVNQQGAWKIFGFDFCILNQTTHDAKPFWPYQEYNSTWHVLTQPMLEYMAPENALISTHSPASDIFSLGMLIFTIYSVGGKPMKNFGKDWGAFKRFSSELKQGRYPSMSHIPDGFVDYVRLMLNATPELRPDIHDINKVPYFDDVGVKTLSYLDALFQWDNLQKSKFYKGLPQIISKLPHRVNMQRILPCLVKEFINAPMVPFVLPNVLLIAENCTEKDYKKHILPPLKAVMKIQDPIQILLIFLQKMDLLLKLTPAEDVKTDVLPMLYRALEADAQQIQELCLSVLPTFASLVDYPAMKNALLPRIKKLCIGTPYMSVRVNCLLCIGRLLEHLDKWLVLDEIIPFLVQIPSREPAVLMGILGIYKLALTNNKLGITKDVMATKVIPFLVPLCIENGLSLSQFNALISLVKDMIDRVEQEHRTKLEQLNSIQQESKALDLNYASATGPLVPSVPTGVTPEMDTMFSNLGLDSYLSKISPQEATSPAVEVKMTSSLLLEDKQRMVKQQEQTQRLQQQPSLVAQQPVQIAPPPKPKDLTSTLIEANLNLMKTTAATTRGSSINNNPSSLSWAPTATPAAAPSWNNGITSPTYASGSTNQWNNNKSTAGNWTALDSLLPNKSTNKMSLNQMPTSNQPLLKASATPSQNQSKQPTNQLMQFSHSTCR
ncbi:SCY1-like protein 2 isoform X2 [Lutzomyia longipalpis]|uniref:SCY1-like protein 2 isoform X2 n=1 Tax=Lutzomyia longipalpis TaxID=7200 RepID=UPI002483AB30|nr:SCY1-like protein 2 isoform X2 [Lutzomyia longipalpis]